jgi:two-component system, NtrC family, sensor kinase
MSLKVHDRNKTKEQLLRELAEMRRKLEEMEAAGLKPGDAERALRESEKRFRTLSEATDAMVFMIRGTRYFYVNPAAEKVTGYSLKELQSMNHWDLAHPDYKEIIRRRGEDRQQGKRVPSWYEYKIISKNGEERWLDVAASYIEYDGQPAVIGTSFDVTDRKRAEEQIKLQELQLIQADKMATLGILVSGIAHEINNPLNFILLNAKIASRVWNEITPILQEYFKTRGDFALAGMPYTKARERIGQLISGISEGAARIEKIVTGLKNFSRQDHGELNQSVEINSVVESALVIVNDLVKKSTNRFSADYGRNLPPIRGSYQQLEQVIINLITNSCQALVSKEKGIAVSTALDKQTQRIRIVIADEGEGIPPENMKHVMDPFFTTKRNSGGTGLGLSISYNIIKDHEGDLRLTSKPGKGTTAEIALPLKRSVDKEGAN